MPEITPDLSDASRCVVVHWSLPVQCVLPSSHRDDHEAWHPQTGNRIRFCRESVSPTTHELHDGAWHDLAIPGPGVVCGEPLSGRAGVFCQMEHGENGNRWNHFALVNGCRYTWHTPPPRPVTVEQLTEDVRSLRKRVAELESIVANAEKLVHGWTKSYADHVTISHLDILRDQPLMAGMQDGRANQYSDCANELRDVLDGEDPDDWDFGIAVEITSTATTGGAS